MSRSSNRSTNAEPMQYPVSPPEMAFDNTKGLDDTTMRTMLGRLEQKAHESASMKLPMLYDLVQVRSTRAQPWHDQEILASVAMTDDWSMGSQYAMDLLTEFNIPAEQCSVCMEDFTAGAEDVRVIVVAAIVIRIDWH